MTTLGHKNDIHISSGYIDFYQKHFKSGRLISPSGLFLIQPEGGNGLTKKTQVTLQNISLDEQGLAIKLFKELCEVWIKTNYTTFKKQIRNIISNDKLFDNLDIQPQSFLEEILQKRIVELEKKQYNNTILEIKSDFPEVKLTLIDKKIGIKHRIFEILNSNNIDSYSFEEVEAAKDELTDRIKKGGFLSLPEIEQLHQAACLGNINHEIVEQIALKFIVESFGETKHYSHTRVDLIQLHGFSIDTILNAVNHKFQQYKTNLNICTSLIYAFNKDEWKQSLGGQQILREMFWFFYHKNNLKICRSLISDFEVDAGNESILAVKEDVMEKREYFQSESNDIYTRKKGIPPLLVGLLQENNFEKVRSYIKANSYRPDIEQIITTVLEYQRSIGAQNSNEHFDAKVITQTIDLVCSTSKNIGGKSLTKVIKLASNLVGKIIGNSNSLSYDNFDLIGEIIRGFKNIDTANMLDKHNEKHLSKNKYLLFFSVYDVVNGSTSENYEQKKFESYVMSAFNRLRQSDIHEVVKRIETYYNNNPLDLQSKQNIVAQYLQRNINKENRGTKKNISENIQHLVRSEQYHEITKQLFKFYIFDMLSSDKKIVENTIDPIKYLEETEKELINDGLVKIIDRLKFLGKKDEIYSLLSSLEHPSSHSISFVNNFITSQEVSDYQLFKKSHKNLISAEDKEKIKHNGIAHHFIDIALNNNNFETAVSILKDFPENGYTIQEVEDRKIIFLLKGIKIAEIFNDTAMLGKIESSKNLINVFSEKITEYLSSQKSYAHLKTEAIETCIKLIKIPWLQSKILENQQSIFELFAAAVANKDRFNHYSDDIYEYVVGNCKDKTIRAKTELWYARSIKGISRQINFLHKLYEDGLSKECINEREECVYYCGKNLYKNILETQDQLSNFEKVANLVKSNDLSNRLKKIVSDCKLRIINEKISGVKSALKEYTEYGIIQAGKYFYDKKLDYIIRLDLGTIKLTDFHDILVDAYQEAIAQDCKDNFLIQILPLWKKYLIKIGNDHFFEYFEKEFGINLKPKTVTRGLTFEEEKAILDNNFGLSSLQSTSSIYLALMLVTPEHFSDEYIKNILILYQNKGEIGFGGVLTSSNYITSKDDTDKLEQIVIKFIALTGSQITQLQKDKAKNILKIIAYHDLGKVTHEGIVQYFSEKIKSGKKIQLLHSLYQELLKEQIEINKSQPENISTDLFMYQKEFVYRFCEGKSNILNADPQGLGKTLQGLAVSETLFERGEINKCLIVAPNKPKEQRIQEIVTHTKITPTYHVVGPNTSIQDLKQAQYILINYERLGGKNISNKIIEYLKNEVGLVILDEAHGIDNHSTNIHQGVKKVLTKKMRVLPLTASIVQDKRHRLNNLASLFGRKIPDNLVLPKNPKDLVKLIKAEPEKLRLFRDYIFNNYIFIRDKDLIFKRGETLPFKEFYTVEYDLSIEQRELYWMVLHDFQRFLQLYGKKDRSDEGKATKHNLTPFSQFYYLRRIETMPEMFGLQENGLIKKLDSIVETHMRNKEKTIIFVAHTNLLNTVLEKFSHHNPVKIDGKTIGYTSKKYRYGPKGTLVEDEENGEYIHQSEYNRILFNSSNDHNLIIVNMKSGAKGLNLSNAKHNIILEPTLKFDEYDQAINRHDRINTPHKNISVINFISRHPAGLTTISEYIASLLFIKQGFDVLMKKGALTQSDLAKITNTSLEGFLKQNNVENEEGVSKDLVHEITQILENHFGIPNSNISGLIKCIEKIKSQNKKLDFIHLVSTYHQCNFNKLVSKFLSGAIDEYAINVLTSARLDPNKNLSFSIINRIIDQYDCDDTKAILQLKDKYMRIPVYIIWTLYKSGLQKSAIDIILNKGNSVSVRNKIYEISGIFGKHINKTHLITQKISQHIIELENMTYNEILNLFRSVQLIGSNEELINQIDLQVGTLGEIQNQINDILHRNIAQEYGIPLSNLLASPEVVAQVLEFSQAYGANQLFDEKHKLLFAFKHHLDGTFDQYKYSSNHENDTIGEKRGVEFMDIWKNNVSQTYTHISTGKNSLHEAIFQAGGILKDLVGKNVLQHIYGNNFETSLLSNLSDKGIDQTLTLLYREKNIRGKSYFLYQHLSKVETKVEFEQKQKTIQRAINFVMILRILSDITKEKDLNIITSKLKTVTSHLQIIFEDLKKTEKTGEYTYFYHSLNNLVSLVGNSINKEKYTQIELIESGDFIDLLNIGTMVHGKKNCFSPHASTKQNRTVVDKITNRYKKMIKIVSPDCVVGTTTLHIRCDEKNKPYMLLDTPFHQGSYNFKKELIEFGLAKISEFKQAGIDIDLVVGNSFINQNEKKEYHSKEVQTQSISGKNSYEYVDAIFAVRETGRNTIPFSIINTPTNQIKSKSSFDFEQIASDYQTINKSEPLTLFTIGTSNKSIEQYINQLKENGIKTVIDIRSKPISQYFPRFNKKAFSKSLSDEGISYIHAPYAGGMQEIDGITYTDFREFMIAEPQKWKEIQDMLMQEIQSHPKGTVALTCAEGNPDECHRKRLIEWTNNPGVIGKLNGDNNTITANHL